MTAVRTPVLPVTEGPPAPTPRRIRPPRWLDLRLVQDQPVYSDTVPLNAVAAQDPPPGTAVSPGATIRVSLSRGSSPFLGAGQP